MSVIAPQMLREICTEFSEQMLSSWIKLSDVAKSELIEKNRDLAPPEQHAAATNGFLHQGRYMTDLTPNEARAVAEKHPIHPDLLFEADAWIESRKRMELDAKIVRQALPLYLRGVSNLQDIRDALPDAALAFYKPIKEIPRTRPEGYQVEGSVLALEQFQPAKRIIIRYAAIGYLK